MIPTRLKATIQVLWNVTLIESDFLLIWIDEKSNQIRLTRLESHAELFKK